MVSLLRRGPNRKRRLTDSPRSFRVQGPQTVINLHAANCAIGLADTYYHFLVSLHLIFLHCDAPEIPGYDMLHPWTFHLIGEAVIMKPLRSDSIKSPVAPLSLLAGN